MGRSQAGRTAPAPPPTRAAPACVFPREELPPPERELLYRGSAKGSHLFFLWRIGGIYPNLGPTQALGGGGAGFCRSLEN